MLPQRRRLKLQLSTRSTEELKAAGTGLKERNEDWGCADTPDEEPLGHAEQPDLHPSAPIVGAGVPEHVGGTPPPPPAPPPRQSCRSFPRRWWLEGSLQYRRSQRTHVSSRSIKEEVLVFISIRAEFQLLPLWTEPRSARPALLRLTGPTKQQRPPPVAPSIRVYQMQLLQPGRSARSTWCSRR